MPAKKKPSFEGNDVLSRGAAYSDAVREAMQKTLERRKGYGGDFSTQAEIRADFIPLRPFLLQWAINATGLRKGGVVEILGKDRLGKTSLLYEWFGGFLQAGCPCAVVIGENKPLDRLWALRCLGSDLDLSLRMLDVIHVLRSDNLDQMYDLLRLWIKIHRDPKSDLYVPHEVPLVVAVDPYGKLATRGEAAGLSTYGKLDQEDETEVNQGSNLERSKWLANFDRKFGVLRLEQNINGIFVTHQNVGYIMEKVPSFIPRSALELLHRTKSGGEALNQSAMLQLILADGRHYKAGTETVARKVNIRVHKNSYGPDGRQIAMAIKMGGFQDTDNFLDPGINFHIPLVDWLAENQYLGFTETNGYYSSEAVGIHKLRIHEAASVLAGSPVVAEEIVKLGERLQIPGYVDLYKRVLASNQAFKERSAKEQAVEEAEEKAAKETKDKLVETLDKRKKGYSKAGCETAGEEQ